MPYTRRKFIKNAGIVSVGSQLVPPGLYPTREDIASKPPEKSGQERIVQAAIDSALSAGARYADARLSHFYATPKYETHGKGSTGWQEEMGIGVRVLFNDSWGFAASPYWSVEEAARLGTGAVNQARANVSAVKHEVELAPHSDFKSGHWETPVKYDPFKMSPYEINDFDNGLSSFMGKLKYVKGPYERSSFSKINKVFGSSNGQHTTQNIYISSLAGGMRVGKDKSSSADEGYGELEDYFPAGAGYEYMRDGPLREEHVMRMYEEALSDTTLPWKPIEPGRYNILVDQPSMGLLLGNTLGAATQADVVFAYQANNIGTSYITEPEDMLGGLKIGNSLLNVSCARDNSGSIGTIGWDDEGVAPVRYNLVEKGILQNLQTHREAASWIRSYLDQSNQLYRSFGCAGSISALYPQTIQSADLTLKGSESPGGVDQLRQDLGDGIEIRLLTGVDMDFQYSTGMTVKGRVYEVKNGKRVARLKNAAAMFRTAELWNNLIRIGGQESVKYSSRNIEKGQPMQSLPYGIYTPPALFKEITFIDETRKA